MKTITKQLKKSLILLVIGLLCQSGYAQFTPGEGGIMPNFSSFTPISGKVGCLIIRDSYRQNNVFYEGTKPIIDLSFLPPSTFGATSYTLQYLKNGTSWENYQYNGSDLTTTGDNFSLNFDNDYSLRLLLNGGPKAGFTSNEVFALRSNINTRFSQWGMDESMFLSGIMAPFVGRGLKVSAYANKLSDDTPIQGFISYQWYRLNPVTYEMTIINGATSDTYTTNDQDVGYNLIAKASGDGVNVGGYIQIKSSMKTILPNNAYANNVSTSGFTLNLYKSINNLSPSQFTLYDKNYEPVTINSITQGSNAAIYNFKAALDLSKNPYYLNSISDFWSIVTVHDVGHLMMMQGVNIDLLSGIEALNQAELKLYPIPSNDIINYKTPFPITKITLFSLNGETLVQQIANNTSGNINISDFNNGIYILQLQSREKTWYKKIQIQK